MTTPSPAPRPPVPSGDDWPAEVASRIDSLVGTVRDKTTVPATAAARGLVYGPIIGVLAAVIVILMVILLIRILNSYLPIHPHARRVWVVDLLASAIFLISGAFLWHKRRPRRV